MQNGIPTEYTLSLTQTAKGFFYVDRLSITAENEDKVLEKMDKLVGEVKKRLEKLNGGDTNVTG